MHPKRQIHRFENLLYPFIVKIRLTFILSMDITKRYYIMEAQYRTNVLIAYWIEYLFHRGYRLSGSLTN